MPKKQDRGRAEGKGRADQSSNAGSSTQTSSDSPQRSGSSDSAERFGAALEEMENITKDANLGDTQLLHAGPDPWAGQAFRSGSPASSTREGSQKDGETVEVQSGGPLTSLDKFIEWQNANHCPSIAPINTPPPLR